MALSRPFAYNNTGSPISGTTQYDDLVVGNIDVDYGADYGGVTWWGGPDEELRYIIGNVRLGGQPVPSGVTETAYVGFWGTPLGNKTTTAFLDLANYVGSKNGQPPFSNANDALIWLNANGFYASYSPPVWSTGGALITAGFGLAGSGEQNAALAFGGYNPSGPLSCTEGYNGCTWSSCGALSTARSNLAGAGTQNAGLAFGGIGGAYFSCTEEYDGTSWSVGGDLIAERYYLAGAGTQDAGLAFGGELYCNILSCTEEYNGCTWSTGCSMITARKSLAGAGTQNAALAFGGLDGTPNIVSCTEEYDGTSWCTGGALSTAMYLLAGTGTQNAGLAFGGYSLPARVTCTEEYNGTSWSAGGAMITARAQLAGAGEQNAALAFGGQTPVTVACTEEYS
jgi:hypothetical protein